MAGRRVEKPGPDRGFVFQNYALFPWMTVRENILYSLHVKKFAKQDQQDRLQEELAALVEGAKTTVLMVTHDVNESVYLSDRVIVMSANKGRIVQDVNIDLDHPRDRQSVGFKAYVSDVTDLVRQAFHEKVVDFELPSNFSEKDTGYNEHTGFTDAYNRMHNRYTNVNQGRAAK